MYEMKTILPSFDMDLPKCMYTLKSLGLKSVDAIDTQNPCNMAKLEERQDLVIKQLQVLKSQLTGIRSTLNFCGKTLEHSKCKPEATDEPLCDIVINAHPNYIPYGLLAVKNIWKNNFNINVKAYSHSTMATLNPKAIDFQAEITENSSTSNNLPGINVSLIWKNTEHTEMISSPTVYVPIYGEVNIIRYLARVGPPEYRYENTMSCNDIDAILDICYQLLRCITVKVRQQLLRSLNARLQKQKYFIGEHLSIADIGVCSSIRRTPSAVKELTENMNKWLNRVKELTRI